jgi:hypothetical protein
MGKAAAVIILITVLVAALVAAVAGLATAARALQRYRWSRAVQQARWESCTEIVGPNTVLVSVRRVARLGRRREELPGSEFAPTRIQISGLGDPTLTEAEGRAQQQADINNTIGLGRG